MPIMPSDLAFDLGIIGVSWNVCDLLVGCLESVFGERPQAEIVVVDNAPRGGSAEMIRSRFPQVKLIVSEKNLGFAAGNNIGIRHWGLDAPLPDARYPPYILLLNPDTVVRSNALETMVHFMDATPQAGICGARLVYGDGGFQHRAFGFPGLTPIARDAPGGHPRILDSQLNGRYSPKLYAGGQPFEIDHPLGASFMMRAEAIR